ncbi:ArsR/SmtB family transcription factor [Actinomadura macra]|uniref:ArsR/SmtB family transcription factor n=1 Tax=Actinomadura macra TaxID=46164 RepID=UPI000A040161|nr:metalloregulator ArsR/SmtB family transcription factor [Actinomadura macra]
MVDGVIGSAAGVVVATRGSAVVDDGPTIVRLGTRTQEFLTALAGESRQQLLVVFAGAEELAVQAVAERLGVAQSTASQQLAQLRRGGLLASRKEGKQVLYRVDTAAVERALSELQTYLGSCCPPKGSS